MNAKVSVIVPFYNVGESIVPTLMSIFNQTYANVEIVLVDDGSTDNSIEVINRLNNKSFHLLKIKNSGPGIARLKGLLHSTGKYIFFLDSDDILHPRAIEILYNAMVEHNAQVAISEYITTNSKEIDFEETAKMDAVKLDKDGLIKELTVCNKIQNFMWGKLYKRDVLFSEDFDTTKKLGEDIATMFKVFNRCDNAVFLRGFPLVFYYSKAGSLSRKLSYLKLNNYCDALLEKTNFIKKRFPQFYSLTFNANIDYFFLIEVNFDRNRIKNIYSLFNHIKCSCKGIKNRLKLFVAKHPHLAKIVLKKRGFLNSDALPKIAVINTYNRFSTGSIAKAIMDGVNVAFDSKLFYGRCKDKYDNESIYFGGGKLYSLINNIWVKLSGKIGCAHKKNTKRLFRYLKKYNPDIIHLHNIHGNYLNYEMLFNYLSDKRVIITMHDCFWLTGRCAHFIDEKTVCDGWLSGCKKCPHKDFYMATLFFDHAKDEFAIKQRFLSESKGIRLVALSSWQKNLFQKNNVILIPNGFDICIDSRKKEKGINDKIVLIGVSQNWIKAKGIEDFNYLAEKLEKSKFELKLIGKIPKGQFVHKNITVLGTCDNNETLRQVAESDLFINPTYVDTFPSVLIESIICGTPVISYDVGGCSDIVGDCGVLVKRGNTEDLLNAIVSFRKEDFNMSKLYSRAEMFNKEKMIENYLNLYEEVLRE